MRLSYPSPIYPKRLSRPLTDNEQTSFWVDMIITNNTGRNRNLPALRPLQGTHPKSKSAYIVSRLLIEGIQWTVVEASNKFFGEVLFWWKTVATSDCNYEEKSI